jgi:hypothetical protein
MGGRIYDPLAGRFMTEDPVMQAPYWSQGLNPYTYVFNDPINHTDPSGFSADVDVGGGIVGGIVGAGHLAAPALMAAGLGANLETAAIGGVAGGINIGVSALLGFPGAGSAPKTFTTPGGTHAPGAVGGAGSNALAQHSEIPQGSAKVQEGVFGLPGYGGGASGVVNGEGGFEGMGSRAPAPFDPGSFLQPDSPGRYRLSGEALKLLRPTFERFGYDLGRIRVQFGRVSSGAETDRDLITIDRGRWSTKQPLGRMQILTHEITHSIQFDELGYWHMRGRLGVERLTKGFEGVYDVTRNLDRLKLGQIDLIDSRFTLESIARKMEGFARSVPP